VIEGIDIYLPESFQPELKKPKACLDVESSPHALSYGCMKQLALYFLLGLFWIPETHAITSISVEIDHVESSAFAAQNVALNYVLDGSESSSVELKAQINLSSESNDATWSDLIVFCGSLVSRNAGEWSCNNGKLVSKQLTMPFELAAADRVTRQGRQLELQISLQEASFHDESGLHAGEEVTGGVNFNILIPRHADHWTWHAEVNWQQGEVFWQPLYFASGGHKFKANGSFNNESIIIDHASLSLNDIGQAALKGTWQRDIKRFKHLYIETTKLDLATLYPSILKPFLEKTAYSDLEMSGLGSLKLDMRDGAYQVFDLQLSDVDIEDNNSRFALYKVNASIPWSYDAVNDLFFEYSGGHLLKIPMGKASLVAKTNRYSLTSPQLRFSVLDGALVVSDVSAAWVNRQWHWHLRAELEPFSMRGLTQALGWPLMEGKVTANIPMVTYSNGYLTTDGSLHFSAFDGDITVHNLTMRDPLGIGPRLNADLQMRNLDLGSLTRTFSFGSIEGKLDGDVTDLQLVNWKPVHFDAEVRSSPGRYRKKISQRAVENISALGGAGAAAAIQRSFLRFFDEFGYSDLGLSCKLRGDVCEMGGVTSTQQGYVIVKGSGVPAITVLGYNERVSWNELLERLERITGGNTEAVIR
jgi:hypothetical protein